MEKKISGITGYDSWKRRLLAFLVRYWHPTRWAFLPDISGVITPK